eukprot:scaffold203514_cov32-Tisochrysis_lutea.AAC.6
MLSSMLHRLSTSTTTHKAMIVAMYGGAAYWLATETSMGSRMVRAQSSAPDDPAFKPRLAKQMAQISPVEAARLENDGLECGISPPLPRRL